MGLCRNIDRPHEAARDIRTGKRLWTCDAPSCKQARVPWGPDWRWFGSIKDVEDNLFSVAALCCDACQAEFDEHFRPKTFEARNA